MERKMNSAVRSRGNPASVTMESLEARKLMWAVVEGDILVVRPSPHIDGPGGYTPEYATIGLSVTTDLRNPTGKPCVIVSYDDNFYGTSIYVPLAGLKGVRAEGTAGNDVFLVDESFYVGSFPLPVTVLGGAGDDILLGGSGDDVLIGGDGNDRARGFGGADQIQAERGIDWNFSTDGPNRYISFYPRGRVDPDSMFANDPLEIFPEDTLLPSPPPQPQPKPGNMAPAPDVDEPDDQSAPPVNDDDTEQPVVIVAPTPFSAAPIAGGSFFDEDGDDAWL